MRTGLDVSPTAATSIRPHLSWAFASLALVELSLACAVWRLGRRALGSLHGLSAAEWVIFGALCAAFVYGEGYLALHRRFAPHVVARAFLLTGERTLYKVLGPAFIVSLVGDRWASQLKAALGVCAIVAAALAVRALPEPWRAMTDGAVSAALLLGLVSMIGHSCKAWVRTRR